MLPQAEELNWGFESAIGLLHALHLSDKRAEPTPAPKSPVLNEDFSDYTDLGDFRVLWEFLGRSPPKRDGAFAVPEEGTSGHNSAVDLEADSLLRGVRWRDELDGADLEDNVELVEIATAASQRTQKRAARRAKAKERAAKSATQHQLVSDTGTDRESDDELDKLRRSPDRRTLIADIVGRPRPVAKDVHSPPTSPSPPSAQPKKPVQQWPISHPFSWQTPKHSPRSRSQILAKDGLTSRGRKAALISLLSSKFQEEKKFLKNAGLLEFAFMPLNVSEAGIHCFVDISNIMIGFHDCLKLARDIPRETRVQRVPLEFHNLSLVLERGRPAAKRVLVGSDKFPVVQKAKSIGYETNILERVHKAKEVSRRFTKPRSGAASSGLETSGSEMNAVATQEKWVEQAVDEILHLKILESLVDAEKPSTIVLATGDAAEAEYSGGFMRMVERALGKGWVVELVSFRLNTSSAYKRRDFRVKWGQMFTWVQLDDYVEYLIDEEE